MIKNVVFDLGRVLVEFDPAAYLRSFGFSDEKVQTLLGVIFGEDWNLHDRGDYKTVDDLSAALIKKYPSLKKDIETVLTGDWVKIHYLKTDTADYLFELKGRGYKIFILSNLSVESYEFISKYPFFSLIDGGVFSYQENCCKPEAKIYKTLISRYSLIPEETVFIDDNKINVEAAREFGIHSVLFTSLDEVRAEVENLF
ncbi:MAG: HAD family phosphatase [Oscillospiraceae bacterium]|nr:HAD family phosphatase [Oscillospiraceae bacterium]